MAVVAASVYGREFAGFRTFRFHGSARTYYLHDREEMEHTCADFRTQRRFRSHRLFLFFLALARRLPLPVDRVWTVADVLREGALSP